MSRSSLSTFAAGVRKILEKDARYREDAYFFVMEALACAFSGMAKARHLSGQELLAAIAREAEEQFGPMASTVLEHWGIKKSLDFGNITFNMVAEGILSKSENDSLDDFRDGRTLRRMFSRDRVAQQDRDGVKNGRRNEGR
jgi:uncharacterized repeat protein (TIGR04138 family)